MNATLEQITVGQLVAERPSRARVFEKLGIDYCCGGKKPLGEACRDKKLEPVQVIAAIRAADEQAAPEEKNWLSASLTELADHIEETHHAYLKAELPRLEFMTRKVAAVHGPQHPELVELQQVFAGFKATLESHMMKEERILFPLCRQLDAAEEEGGRPGAFHCGSINNPIRVMVMEHEHAGDALGRMRELTNGFTAPEDACNTFKAMLAGLAEVEADMHRHVHKENEILFPKAVEAEAKLR